MGYLGLRIKIFEPDESNPWPHPTYFIMFMHSTSVISVSITLFAIYCIINHSAQMAKTYRHLLLIHLMWTFAFEINLNTMVTPVLFTPFKAGYYNGVFEWLGVPPQITITIGLGLVAANMLSFIQLFVYRLYCVLPQGSKLRKRFLVTQLFIILYIFVISFATIPIYFLYDLKQDRFVVATEQWGHIPQQLYQWNVLYCGRSPRNNILAVVFAVGVVLMTLCPPLVGFFTFISIWNHKAMSDQTKKVQLTLIWVLIIQVLAFGAFNMGPVIIILAGALVLDFLPVYCSNMIVFMISVSGTADTLAMLAVTRSYRMFIFHQVNRILTALKLSKGLISTEDTPVASGSDPSNATHHSNHNNPAASP